MKPVRRHSWRLTPSEAMRLQDRLGSDVVAGGRLSLRDDTLVAGLDVSYSRPTDRCYAAVVVVRLGDLETVASVSLARASPFPYVPGLLSFREAPPLAAALARLRVRPDVLLCDAQGRAHPRRMGLASHIGLLYDMPSVGCAKTRLTGHHEPPGLARGDWTPLRDEATGGVIGSVLRTREGVKPVYVSVGHRVTDAASRRLVLAATRGYRLPEPIRRAHHLSNELRLRRESGG